MSLTVRTDLSVTPGSDQLEEKLEDKRNAMRESFLKGEPKVFGVTQIALGLMVISYSIPLLGTETTLILKFGVPWWCGLMFVFLGAVAIAVEKHAKIKTLNACLAVSVVAIVVAVISFVLYFIDIAYHPVTTCKMESNNVCDHQFYATHFSTGVKTTIAIIIVVQAVMCSAFLFILYKQRKNFTGYSTVNDTAVTPSD